MHFGSGKLASEVMNRLTVATIWGAKPVSYSSRGCCTIEGHLSRRSQSLTRAVCSRS
jgi:hypothetical protein